jgi:hypothetical protein
MELANIVFGYSLLYALRQFGCGFLFDRFSFYLVIFVSEHYGPDRLFLICGAAGFAAAGMLIPLWNLKPSDHSETIGPPLQLLDRELTPNL